MRYVPPTGDFYIDIMTRLGEAFGFEQLQIQQVDLEGIRVKVATPETLYNMKKSTVRLQDRADAEALKDLFEFE